MCRLFRSSCHSAHYFNIRRLHTVAALRSFIHEEGINRSLVPSTHLDKGENENSELHYWTLYYFFNEFDVFVGHLRVCKHGHAPMCKHVSNALFRLWRDQRIIISLFCSENEATIRFITAVSLQNKRAVKWRHLQKIRITLLALAISLSLSLAEIDQCVWRWCCWWCPCAVCAWLSILVISNEINKYISVESNRKHCKILLIRLAVAVVLLSPGTNSSKSFDLEANKLWKLYIL